MLIALALLLLVAQLSFDRYDVEANRAPANETTHNWIGSAGAHAAWGFFWLFGGGAYVLPVLLLIFGAGYLFEFLAYLKRRWVWGALLFVCCIGFLDLYTNKDLLTAMAKNPGLPAAGFMEHMAFNLNAGSAGGVVGRGLNDVIFAKFGKVGATVIFITLYVISLIFLTNFHLGGWLRAKWASRGEAAEEPVDERDWSPARPGCAVSL